VSTPHLDIAITRYDHKRALFDGSVTFDGLDATLHSPAIPEIFAGLASDRFDVAEFGLTHYLRALDLGTDLVAIPVFPARVFRHSSVFVNTGKGITGLADLVGRTIGEYGMYDQDSGIWAKGIFTEDYGFAPETNRWVVGGLETPLPPGSSSPRTDTRTTARSSSRHPNAPSPRCSTVASSTHCSPRTCR
jgi:4,5-dihydroxyphthalate decarboxylase